MKTTMNRKEARAVARAALEGRSGDAGELYDIASDAVLAALVGTDVPDDDVQDIARDAAQWAVYEHQEAQ